MRFDEKEAPKRKYSRISLKKRQNLVKMVQEDNYTIARAARRLAMKPSTARMILHKYKETGTFPSKNFKKPLRSDPRPASDLIETPKIEEPMPFEFLRKIDKGQPSEPALPLKYEQELYAPCGMGQVGMPLQYYPFATFFY